MRKPQAAQSPIDLFANLDTPEVPKICVEPYDIFITGVGGTGVITIGTLLGMAAHLDGKGCSVVDMAGLAQKGGAVVSHVRLANSPDDIHATRVSARGADLILGFDVVVTAGKEALSKINPGITRVLTNTHKTITGHFTKNPDYFFPAEAMETDIIKTAGATHAEFLDAQEIATNLMGDSLMTNMFMVGYALQKGYIPVSHEALKEAIRLNGVAIQDNLMALQWGRLAATNMTAVESFLHRTHAVDEDHILSETAEQIIDRRAGFLAAYQSKRYARQYRRIIAQVRKVEAEVETDQLTRDIAQSLYRLMAYKDEYEVARLYTNGDFKRRLDEQFEGKYQLQFHLAPPLMSKRNEKGELQKKVYGSKMMLAFKLLSLFKFLRGTPFDVFGYTAERRMERRLIKDYQKMIDRMVGTVRVDNVAQMCEIAQLPQKIRGFGHVKHQNYEMIQAQMKAFMEG